MQRVGSSFSTGQQELGENRVTSRCPSVALSEGYPVAILPVRLLKNDLAVVPSNSRVHANFQMKLDAQGFAPEELMVRVDGQNLTVTGQRQEVSNDGVRGGYRIEQTMHRQMLLPPNLDLAAMTCNLTPSGHLWVLGQKRSLPPPEAQGHGPRFKSRASKHSN
ncbi:heat shock protein beta-9 [Cricetulus griseus]|uniref:Heat shock protein beta-9 n=1 Tax=Cricetulus griseus TaxID=10029 RepID=G3HLW4_CRIGR|nr:heat shock protein beta-9 [Cricetulus griseus]XP_035313109.1 heat shock protein beta-9 [Cricetulus griseus]EGW08036.1 Heat shock protein beta-9 [Cricetulus griseus]